MTLPAPVLFAGSAPVWVAPVVTSRSNCETINPMPEATTYDVRTPVRPTNAVAAAIAAHHQAYEASLASRARLWALLERFDPDHELQDPDAIKAALASLPAGAGLDPATYIVEQARCVSLAAAEDEAWLAVRSLVPVDREQLAAWHAYVVEHSAKEDEVVNLRAALAHVVGLLADHLARSTAGR